MLYSIHKRIQMVAITNIGLSIREIEKLGEVPRSSKLMAIFATFLKQLKAKEFSLLQKKISEIQTILSRATQ